MVTKMKMTTNKNTTNDFTVTSTGAVRLTDRRSERIMCID